MKRIGMLFLTATLVGIAAVAVWQAQNEPPSYKFSTEKIIFGPDATNPDLRYPSFQLKDVIEDKNNLRLVKSVLVTDEMGATDFHQDETLSDKVQAKKIFTLANAEFGAADLYFFDSAKDVSVNGKAVNSERLVSTGWSHVRIPDGLLKKGNNEVIFKGAGSLLLEPGKQPGHSFKSTDGGQSWSQEGLTAKGNQQGEYLVRLRLGKFAAKGWAVSQVFDLWQTGKADVPEPAILQTVEGLGGFKGFKVGVPNDSSIKGFVRFGGTPTPDDKYWTNWTKFFVATSEFKTPNTPFSPDKNEAAYRWAQLKLELAAPEASESSQVYGSFGLSYGQGKAPPRDKTNYKVTVKPATHHPLSPTPFVYQAPSPRLKHLREHFKLDQVIAPGKTELEQLMLLRYWVRNQWHTAWGSHPAAWMPPWDALMILQCKDQPECLTMCTHYAAVFTQCCLALGWNARHCILDHHCVAEVYVNDFGKWVMMDAGNSPARADVGLHFERNGVPLSARELHLANKSGKTEDLQVCFTPNALAAQIAPLCRPAPPAKQKYPPRPDVVPAKELKNYPVCGLENYRRYAFPPRNNYMDTLLPGELYQGWSEYFYDGYYWVGDSPDAPTISPEYSLHLDPNRPQDIDWPLNWTQVYLSRTDKPGQLRVDLGTVTPNFLHFERTFVGPAGLPAKGEAADTWFLWQLQNGTNTLTVRSVNAWHKKGAPVQVTVEVKGL